MHDGGGVSDDMEDAKLYAKDDPGLPGMNAHAHVASPGFSYLRPIRISVHRRQRPQETRQSSSPQSCTLIHVRDVHSGSPMWQPGGQAPSPPVLLSRASWSPQAQSYSTSQGAEQGPVKDSALSGLLKTWSSDSPASLGSLMLPAAWPGGSDSSGATSTLSPACLGATSMLSPGCLGSTSTLTPGWPHSAAELDSGHGTPSHGGPAADMERLMALLADLPLPVVDAPLPESPFASGSPSLFLAGMLASPSFQRPYQWGGAVGGGGGACTPSWLLATPFTPPTPPTPQTPAPMMAYVQPAWGREEERGLLQQQQGQKQLEH